MTTTTMPAPTVLTFEYVEDEHALKLSGRLVETWDEKDCNIGYLSLGELAEQKMAFRKDVRNLEERCGSRLCFGNDPYYVYTMLEQLFRAGRRFWKGVSDGNIAWLGRVGDFLATGLPGNWWSAPDSCALARSVYQVQTKGPPRALLPLDALPLGLRDSLDLAEDETDVFRLASLFGGFRSIVRHSPLAAGTYRHPPTRGNQATLYFRSVGLEGSTEMSTILEKATATLIGTFPSPKDYHDPEDVARALVIPEPALGRNPIIPDIIQIHAHALEGESLAEELQLTFKYGSGKGDFIVVLSSHIEAIDEERDIFKDSDTSMGTGPLVVFNACEALGTIGHEALSSALDLSKLGSRAVIGPREKIL